MAKVISDEILKLKIIVNGDEAQKRVTDLELKNKDLYNSIKDLNRQREESEKTLKKEEIAVNKYAGQIEKLTLKINQNKKAAVDEIMAISRQQKAYDSSSTEYIALQKKRQDAQARVIATNAKLEYSIQQLEGKYRKQKDSFTETANKVALLKNKISDFSNELDANNKLIDKEVGAMDILKLTSHQLTQRIRDLSLTLQHLDPNTEKYKSLQEELKSLNTRQQELRNGARDSSFSISNLADRFNHYSGLAVAAAGALAGVALSMQNVIDMNNKMADAMSAVEKTTGLTTVEVKDLTKAFTDFDTRTSKMDLLKIAEVGGRLGIPKAEIKDFVEEVDKAYVALGDSFSGGVENVAEGIGKIAGLYKETKGQEFAISINQIGSALNELGANGAASEENIADFTRRIGALPEALKPSITDAMALGAAFEESGIDAERAGTAYTNFISTAAKETAAFARVMNLSEKQVKDMINTDPTKFFLTFSEGLKGMNATDVSKTLESLKLGDQYVKSIVGAASENTDKFRKTMELSAQAAAEATSLQKEFDKVNNNSAAIYEKVRKKFVAMFTSDEVAKTLNWIILTIGKLLGVVEDAGGGVTSFKEKFILLTKIVTIGVVAFYSYNTAIALSNLTLASVKKGLLELTVVQKVNNLYTQTAATFQNLWNISIGYSQLALGRLTASSNMQIAAQNRLNLVTKANPWALFVSVIMALATAYLLLAKNADEAANKQKFLNDLRADAASKVANEKAQLENLLQVARDETLSKEARLNAIKKLNEIAPEYLGNLTLENLKTKEGIGLINNYIKMLDRKAMAEVLSAKRGELMKKQYEIQKDDVDAGIMDLGGIGSWLEQKVNDGNLKRSMTANEAKQIDAMTKVVDIEKALAQYVPLVQQQYQKRRAELRANYKELQLLNGEQRKYIQGNANEFVNANTSGGSNYTVPTDGDKPGKTSTPRKSEAERDAESAQKKYERERDKILETAEANKQRLEELEAERIKNIAEIQKDGYEKERDLLLAEQDKTIAEIEKKKVKGVDMEKLRTMIDREKGVMKTRLQEIEFQWLEENARLSSLQEQEKEKTNFKLLTLDIKYIKEAYKKHEEALQDRLKLLERQQNTGLGLRNIKDQKEWLKNEGYSDENLAKIKTWEEGRSAIEKFYQEKRLQEQLNYLKKSVAEFNVAMALNPMSITPEQLKIIEDYQNQIAALVAEIAKLKGEETDSKLGGALSSFGGQKDVLGLTPDQWEAMFTNTNNLSENIQKVGAAIQVAQQLFGAYSEFVQANEQRMLQQAEVASQRKQTSLDKRLKAGLINQETYKKLTLANEKELDAKKARLEYEAAKRQRVAKIGETIANTAMAIMNIWAQSSPFIAPVLTAIVGGLGAIQLATIMSAPLPTAPGAEDGFYPVLREQDNKLFRARKRKSQTGMYNEATMLVGEQGRNFPELVVAGEDLKRVDPNITNMFMRDIQRVRGFEKGLYPDISTAPTKTNNNDEVMLKILYALELNNETMQDIKRTGLRANIEKSAQNGKSIEEMIEDYNNIKNRNKHG